MIKTKQNNQNCKNPKSAFLGTSMRTHTQVLDLTTRLSKINKIKSIPKHALDLTTNKNIIKICSSIYQIIQFPNRNMMRHNNTKLNKTKHISMKI